MFHRKNYSRRSAIKKKNENKNPHSDISVPKDNGKKLSSILESMKLHQLLLLFSGIASVGIGRKLLSGIPFRACQILLYVCYFPILILKLCGTYHYRNNTLLLLETFVPYIIVILAYLLPMTINWEKALDLIYILENDSVFSRLQFETHERKELVLNRATKQVTMIFYASFIGIFLCSMGWFLEPHFFKMLEKFTTDPNLKSNSTELDPLKLYSSPIWYPGIDLTVNPSYTIVQSFVFVLVLFVILKLTATLTVIMGLIVYIYEMFELVSISIQDIDKLNVNGNLNQINNCSLTMNNSFQKPFHRVNMKDTEGLRNDKIEEFIDIEEDPDLKLLDTENELKANYCLRNVIIDHQQVIK